MKIIKGLLVLAYAIGIICVLNWGYESYISTGYYVTEFLFPMLYTLIFLYGIIATIYFTKQGKLISIIRFFHVIYLLGILYGFELGYLAYSDTGGNYFFLLLAGLFISIFSYGIYINYKYPDKKTLLSPKSTIPLFILFTSLISFYTYDISGFTLLTSALIGIPSGSVILMLFLWYIFIKVDE